MSETKKAQTAFVDLYAILGVAPEAETADILRRIQSCYSEAQQNLNHSSAHKRLQAQQLFHVYLPQARQVLLQEASRAEYDRQRERALSSTHDAAAKAEAERRQNEARIAQEMHSYSVNAALDSTLVFALMATTLLFLLDVVLTSMGGYPQGVSRTVVIFGSITIIAITLVWHFGATRRRVMKYMRRAGDHNNPGLLHAQSEQCKRAAWIEGAVLLVGLSVLNALDEKFLPGGYPLGSRLLFNVCMSVVLALIFFAGRQCCIHAKHPARVKNETTKTRKP